MGECRTLQNQMRDSLVTATWRFTLPSSITSITSSGLVTNRSVQPLLKTKHKHSFIPRKRNKHMYPKYTQPPSSICSRTLPSVHWLQVTDPNLDKSNESAVYLHAYNNL